MSTLERAIEIALDAHKGQTDKAGAPYILHPLRLMLGMDDLLAQMVSVLHDVLEDSDWTAGKLRDEGFPEEVVEAVISVTRLDGETYHDFILKAAANPIGRRVKLADLKDNANLSRIANPTEADYSRNRRYIKAIALIESQS